jgi:ribosomal protein RSM22 (predicted rRNA methylase)
LAERQPSKLHVASSNLVSRSNESPPPDRRPALAANAASLRSALARTITAGPDVAAAAASLSAVYRSRERVASGAGHVGEPRLAAAYAAARMPATFATSGLAMLEAARSLPAFAPGSLLDVGAGTGAAAWAARAVWPTIDDVVLIDREPQMIELGRKIAVTGDPGGPLAHATWRTERIGAGPIEAADVVTAAYVLAELDDGELEATVTGLWAATRGALVIVEPGSPAGFRRILAARAELIGAGALIAAPCPGRLPCPVGGSNWCHFLARVDRSPLHRRAKAATRSWEDEPYSYVIATRLAADPAPRAVLGRPRHGSGRVELRICAADGQIHRPIISRRDGAVYRAARDVAWGDRIPLEVATWLPGMAVDVDPDVAPSPPDVLDMDGNPPSGG